MLKIISSDTIDLKTLPLHDIKRGNRLLNSGYCTNLSTCTHGIAVFQLVPTFDIVLNLGKVCPYLMWHADRGRFLFRTPCPVPLGLAYSLLVETNPFSELVVIFSDYAFRIILGTFSILLCIIV